MARCKHERLWVTMTWGRARHGYVVNADGVQAHGEAVTVWLRRPMYTVKCATCWHKERPTSALALKAPKWVRRAIAMVESGDDALARPTDSE